MPRPPLSRHQQIVTCDGSVAGIAGETGSAVFLRVVDYGFVTHFETPHVEDAVSPTECSRAPVPSAIAAVTAVTTVTPVEVQYRTRYRHRLTRHFNVGARRAGPPVSARPTCYIRVRPATTTVTGVATIAAVAAFCLDFALKRDIRAAVRPNLDEACGATRLGRPSGSPFV